MTDDELEFTVALRRAARYEAGFKVREGVVTSGEQAATWRIRADQARRVLVAQGYSPEEMRHLEEVGGMPAEGWVEMIAKPNGGVGIIRIGAVLQGKKS